MGRLTRYATMLREGQSPRGVYIACSGRWPAMARRSFFAQMIGSSRETGTRLFSDMKRKDLIRLEGATLVIPNRIVLQAIAAKEFPPRADEAVSSSAPF
jgi:CRP-like cAMP-binding protein